MSSITRIGTTLVRDTSYNYTTDVPHTPFLNYQKEKLNEFLRSSGVPPVNVNDLDISSAPPRTRSRYIGRACDVMSAVVKTLSPSNPGRLWEVLRTSSKLCDDLNVSVKPVKEKQEDPYLKALAEAYLNASSNNVKRQIVSTIADLATLSEIRRYIPGLSKYAFCEARKHCLLHGRGILLSPQMISRTRYDKGQLDDFLDFITSPYIIQDLPFGEKKLRLSSGEVLNTPNVIRISINERIINQYIQYCNDNSKTHLSRSTLRRVLSACKASSRKSLQGLDYFSTDGSNAFDELIKLLDKLVVSGTNQSVVENVQAKLKLGRNYIKSDFKVSF